MNIKVQNDEGRWYILGDKHMQELPMEGWLEGSCLRVIRRSNIKRFFSHGGSIEIRYTASSDVNPFTVQKFPGGSVCVGCASFSPATVETIKKWAQAKTARRDLTKPCDTCPFRNDIPAFLTLPRKRLHGKGR